jgi:hypothetical protein
MSGPRKCTRPPGDSDYRAADVALRKPNSGRGALGVRAPSVLVGERIAQPLATDPLQRAVVFQLGLRDGDAAE